ncbi:MAG: hypothetical protein D6689_15060 [Deltaproteobacteria bacterium]|nr:MAG: hypothetical protein D6689_15060 [Deltaproteobacteria bacterium]
MPAGGTTTGLPPTVDERGGRSPARLPSPAEAHDRVQGASAGAVVGSYRLERLLGSGAMGEVWLGRHVRTDRPAAVKVLRRRRRGTGAAEFLSREARAIARLSHPHIVRLYELGTDYLVTAYIDGTTLARRIKTPVSPAEAVAIALPIASALEHAHARGVVHRDVKPSNILLDHNGTPFLADFGLAYLAGDGAGGVRGGTPGFMAPEQMESSCVGPAADQYALARTLLEMLIGARAAESREEALAQLPPALPRELVDLLRRATAPNPADRWPSLAEFTAKLADIDLSAFAPPQRLARDVRIAAPFAWAARTVGSDRPAPDIARVDYRLSVLDAAGELPADRVAAFRARSGYADFGWTAYGRPGRLGALDRPHAYARASELYVLLHGWAGTRAVWETTAQALCRDNAEAIVLVPDVAGFGETRYATRKPDPEFVGPRGIVLGVLAWLDLLGLGEIPTVLVGHSMLATGLMAIRDDELGPLRSRVAVTPVFPFCDKVQRRRIRRGEWLIRTLAWFPPLYRYVARKEAFEADCGQDVPVRYREDTYHNFVAVGPSILRRTLAALGRTEFARGDQLRRCEVVIGARDPWCPEDVARTALEALEFPAGRYHLMAAGGHLPQIESESHPEWTARNQDDLVRIISNVVVEAHSGTLLSTELASPDAGASSGAGASPGATDATLPASATDATLPIGGTDDTAVARPRAVGSAHSS